MRLGLLSKSSWGEGTCKAGLKFTCDVSESPAPSRRAPREKGRAGETLQEWARGGLDLHTWPGQGPWTRPPRGLGWASLGFLILPAMLPHLALPLPWWKICWGWLVGWLVGFYSVQYHHFINNEMNWHVWQRNKRLKPSEWFLPPPNTTNWKLLPWFIPKFENQWWLLYLSIEWSLGVPYIHVFLFILIESGTVHLQLTQQTSPRIS